MKRVFIIFSLLMIQNVHSQENPLSKIKFSGNAEIFYSFDFNQPSTHVRHPFFYTYNRHNEVNLNLAMIKANYENEYMRANVALMTGVYPHDNMATEEETLKIVNEANIGFRISKTKNIWIDVGIMPSHIGLEGAIGKDNLTLTRTVAIENSPYFETGVKLSYTTDDGKWTLIGEVLNGWQKIKRTNSSSQMLAFGHEIIYKPNSKWLINSGSFIGKDPTTETKLRYFHDFYAIYNPTEKLTFNFAFDFGAEQKSEGSNIYNIWWTPNLIAKYQITPKFSISGRAEYYHDPKNVMGLSNTEHGFQIFGLSTNFDYLINSNLLWRIEFRNLKSRDAIFKKIDEFHPPVDNNFFITTSLSTWF